MRRFRYHHYYYYPHMRTAYGPNYQSRPRRHVHMAEEWALSAREMRSMDSPAMNLCFEVLPNPNMTLESHLLRHKQVAMGARNLARPGGGCFFLAVIVDTLTHRTTQTMI